MWLCSIHCSFQELPQHQVLFSVILTDSVLHFSLGHGIFHRLIKIELILEYHMLQIWIINNTIWHQYFKSPVVLHFGEQDKKLDNGMIFLTPVWKHCHCRWLGISAKLIQSSNIVLHEITYCRQANKTVNRRFRPSNCIFNVPSSFHWLLSSRMLARSRCGM